MSFLDNLPGNVPGGVPRNPTVPGPGPGPAVFAGSDGKVGGPGGTPLEAAVANVAGAYSTGRIPDGRPLNSVRGTGMVPAFSNTQSYPINTTAAMAADGGSMLRSRHQACFDAAAVRLVYGNFIDQGNVVPDEAPGLNPILVRASFEYAAAAVGGKALPIKTNSILKNNGNPTAWSSTTAYAVGDQVTSGGSSWVCVTAHTNQPPAVSSQYWAQAQFMLAHFPGENAARDVTIYPGQVVLSDLIALNPFVPKGQYVYVNTLCQPNNGVANTGSYPGANVGGVKPAVGEWGIVAATGSAPPDFTAGSPLTTTTTFPSTPYAPMAIIAYPKDDQLTPVIWLLGDSVADGSTDTSWGTARDIGWMIRMLADDPAAPTEILWPHYRSSKTGGIGARQFGAGLADRSVVGQGCNIIVDEYVTNDIPGIGNLATIQAAALARWEAWAAMGLEVYATTCTPQSTSTDSWATVANQTPAANFGANSIWSQYNAWLTTQVTPNGPLTGVIDCAAAVTNTTAGGTNAIGTVWQPGLVTTSPHPNQAGHIAIAQAINPTALFGAAP